MSDTPVSGNALHNESGQKEWASPSQKKEEKTVLLYIFLGIAMLIIAILVGVIIGGQMWSNSAANTSATQSQSPEEAQGTAETDDEQDEGIVGEISQAITEESMVQHVRTDKDAQAAVQSVLAELNAQGREEYSFGKAYDDGSYYVLVTFTTEDGAEGWMTVGIPTGKKDFNSISIVDNNKNTWCFDLP